MFYGDEQLAKAVLFPGKMPPPCDEWSGESSTSDDETSNDDGARSMTDAARPRDGDTDIGAVVSAEISALLDQTDLFTADSA